jgi:hypothetical protein
LVVWGGQADLCSTRRANRAVHPRHQWWVTFGFPPRHVVLHRWHMYGVRLFRNCSRP